MFIDSVMDVHMSNIEYNGKTIKAWANPRYPALTKVPARIVFTVGRELSSSKKFRTHATNVFQKNYGDDGIKVEKGGKVGDIEFDISSF